MKREELRAVAKPILFNTEMVLAIQNQQKTVTRRVIKKKRTNTVVVVKSGKAFETAGTPSTTREINPPYKAGDILYVRETWNYLSLPEPLRGTSKTYLYKADGTEAGDKWRPSLHMPKEAARIFLRVKSVRPEWLQDITNEQAAAEGIVTKGKTLSARHIFKAQLWNSTVKKSELEIYGWNANPGVWVIEFEKLEVER